MSLEQSTEISTQRQNRSMRPNYIFRPIEFARTPHTRQHLPNPNAPTTALAAAVRYCWVLADGGVLPHSLAMPAVDYFAVAVSQNRKHSRHPDWAINCSCSAWRNQTNTIELLDSIHDLKICSFDCFCQTTPRNLLGGRKRSW